MIPKIKFKYSWIYDQKWKEWMKFYRPDFKTYPSEKTIIKYIKDVKKLWKGEEKKVLGELSKITKLKWKSKTITCYVVGQAMPFSDPLTVPIYDEKNWFTDVLTHELIHQLFTQEGNQKKAKLSWKYLEKKYKPHSKITINHIPLFAIHSYIYLKFYSKKRLNHNIKIMSYYKGYKEAWEIVQKEGYENIIKEFVGRIQ